MGVMVCTTWVGIKYDLLTKCRCFQCQIIGVFKINTKGKVN